MLDHAKRQLHWTAEDGMLVCDPWWGKERIEIRPVRVRDDDRPEKQPFLAWAVRVDKDENGDDMFLEHWVVDFFGDEDVASWYVGLPAAMCGAELWVRGRKLARHGKVRRWSRRLSGLELTESRLFKRQLRRYYGTSAAKHFARLLTDTVDYWSAR